MKRILCMLLLALGLSVPAFANPDFDLGPAVGTAAPDIGTLADSTGTPRSLSSVMGEKGLVLFFYRSAAWCPYCQLQLMNLNSGAADIAKRGYGLAGISYEKPPVNANFIAQNKISYPLLSDPNSEIIDRYGLRDPQYRKGSRAYGVPRPIIFILDRYGTIRAKLYEDNYIKRPPVSLVIETLNQVSAKAH
jgi:peroxiredoxin